MKCPKCNYIQDDGNAECGNCGLIFSRWAAQKASPNIEPAKSNTKLYLTFAFVGLGAFASYSALSKSDIDRPEKAPEPVADRAAPNKGESARGFERERMDNATMDENCRRSILEMGGSEEDVQAGCFENRAPTDRP